MATHNLVVFWREQQSRCFTAWHFQPSSLELASQRAQKILSAVTQLSTLQIYGAAIDKDSLLFNSIPSAQPSGSLTRLEVSLTPNIKEVVGGGQIRFSLPVPTLSLSQLLAAKPFSAPEGQLIEKEVISSLCSPKAIPVSVSTDQLLKAALDNLYSQPPSQPTDPPF